MARSVSERWAFVLKTGSPSSNSAWIRDHIWACGLCAETDATRARAAVTEPSQSDQMPSTSCGIASCGNI
eukprot:4774895-Pyramimonas_sp.AAC.1